MAKKKKSEKVIIQLPKNALERIQIGTAFAEYDVIRNDPQLFVTTPAIISALNKDNTNCFFVGRRGAGKTAITYEIQRRFPRTIQIIPQIFDLLKLPLDLSEFKDTRQRPFKSLMHAMERALLGEVIKIWGQKGIFRYDRSTENIRRERGLIEDCNFDQRVLNLTEEIFEAYRSENDKLWLRQINRSKDMINEVNNKATTGSYDFIILIDRLDESWDGSESAIICLMALMHAAVRLTAATTCIRPYIFIRENIYDRIRSLDNEFSRLETSVVFLEWTPAKLIELVERRLIKPFNSKPKLGGEAWSYFFEEENSADQVISLCQRRPRDLLMLISYAINSAVSNGNAKIKSSDLDNAGTRYSTSRLKDLGDEFAENYPNISVVIEYFFGLGNEFTFHAIDQFIKKLLVNSTIKNLCKEWFFEYSAPHRFVELFYSIGFLGIKRGNDATYKESSRDSNVKPAFDNASTFVIHPTYHQALNLRRILISDLQEDAELKNEGILEDLPDSFQLDDYKQKIEDTLQKLKSLKTGVETAKEFEVIVGDIIKLCFFRSLVNVEPHERTFDGVSIRDWVASNRAEQGFWDVIRQKYGATQVVWECKNYEDLSASDFQQVSYYLNDSFGKFGIIAFRGKELKEQYLKHISRALNTNKSGFILPLTQKDLEVFLRQAYKGTYRESHIQDKYDQVVRKVG